MARRQVGMIERGMKLRRYSIFYGEELLNTPNPGASQDHRLFHGLGISAMD